MATGPSGLLLAPVTAGGVSAQRALIIPAYVATLHVLGVDSRDCFVVRELAALPGDARCHPRAVNGRDATAHK